MDGAPVVSGLPAFRPLARPLSVVVVGNSLAVLSIPQRTGREDGSYAEVLRDLLTDAGQPVVLHNEARWFDFAVHALRRYQETIRAGVPDVVVLQFGLNESQPWLLPVPVVRHFITNHTAVTRAAQLYRSRVVPPVWKSVRSYRRWASGKVGTRTWQTTPARFEGTMKALVRAVRYECRPLVLVCDVNTPGGVLTHFLPGMEERHAIVQDVLHRVVEDAADPEVRLVRTSDVVRELGEREAMPDGMHYSPGGHAAVGRLLAVQIAGWLAERDRP